MKTVILGVVGLLVLYLGIRTYQRLETKKKIETAVKTFQDFCAFDLKHSGELCTDTLSKKPILLLFIHPECEFCQEEINYIKNLKAQLEGLTLLLVTHAEKEQAFEFYTHHQLAQFDNLHLLVDDYLKVAGLYGTPPVPSVFLYDADKQLLFKHSGEIKIEAILKYISN
ncbi:MAG: redoxin domain-containing protein [Bacteroidales bacterium]|nr:redoxin domain-containing protein [Bacteroidales bacterium]